MKYSAIIVINTVIPASSCKQQLGSRTRSNLNKKVEEKIAFLSDLFDEVILVCEDLVSLTRFKPLSVKPFSTLVLSREGILPPERVAKHPIPTLSWTRNFFLNFIHAGLFVSRNEWCFVCGVDHNLDVTHIKKMKGYLSKSQVVLWDEDPKLGFYRKHSLKKIKELLQENKSIHDFLKSVRIRTRIICHPE